MSRDERPCVQQGISTSYSFGKHKAAHKPHTRAAKVRIYRGSKGMLLMGKSVVNSGDEVWSEVSFPKAHDLSGF